MRLYFGQSVFLLKARLSKLPNYSAAIYALLSISFCVILFGIDTLILLLSGLLLGKVAQTFVWNECYLA